MKSCNFNEGWTVSAYGETKNVVLPYDFMVGHPRSADSTAGGDQGYFVPGRATYTKRFTSDKSSKHTFFRFDGVMGFGEVWLNNNLIAKHAYGYTPFIACADDYLLEGENELQVTADTTAQPCSRWYTGGGIYRDVEILTCDEDYFTSYGANVRTLSVNANEAYVSFEFEVFAEKSGCAVLKISVDKSGEELTSFVRRVWLEKGINRYDFKKMLHGVEIWDTFNPVIYNCRAELTTERSSDSTDVTFGIRTVEYDSDRGFLLNGRVIKLFGTCDHHDNGIVGSASFRSAEERRVRILKENGYNAIRCAHNPPSSVLLDVCDRMGMLVIDEIFDCWRVGKRDFDYHIWFDSYFAQDTEAMVLRDRHHPSVIMWSTGNEIPEKDGTSGAYSTAKKVRDIIRANDDTRPITNAFCLFWENPETKQKYNESLGYGSEVLDYYTDRISYISDSLDIIGYNYLLDRLDKDEVRFADKLFVMTESFPLDAYKAKKRLDTDSRFIGEFVWTGWDYFGETCIGHVDYGSEGNTGWGLCSFPMHISDCGDFDICGNIKPAGLYRMTAWNPGLVKILTEDPEKHGHHYGISAWGFYDVQRSWNYSGCEGMKTDVYVFTTEEECELLVNGKSVGTKKTDENGKAVFEIEYEPGVLEARAVSCGMLISCDTIETADFAVRTEVYADRSGVTGASDLVYLEISAVDSLGRIAVGYGGRISIIAEGAEVLGTGSGKNFTEHVYTDNTCEAYNGKILAALRPTSGRITVTVRAENLPDAVVMI